MGNEPLSIAALTRYCEEHAGQIFVRAKQPDGAWKTVPFSELDDLMKAHWIAQWAKHGILPVRLPD